MKIDDDRVSDRPGVAPGSGHRLQHLPEYENVLLAHLQRVRINPLGLRRPLPPANGARAGTVLIDGIYQADWNLVTGGRDVVTLSVRPFAKTIPGREAELEDADRRHLQLVEAERTRSIRSLVVIRGKPPLTCANTSFDLLGVQGHFSAISVLVRAR